MDYIKHSSFGNISKFFNGMNKIIMKNNKYKKIYNKGNKEYKK